MTARRRTGRTLIIVACLMGLLAMVVVAGGLLYARGGVSGPAARARADVEAGYEAHIDDVETEETARRDALEPVLGEPLEQTWYVSCSGVEPGLLIPAIQHCELSVTTTYAMAWDDPSARLDEVLTVLEGTDILIEADDGPDHWHRTEGAGDVEPRGKVAEVGTGDGTVYVRGPGTEVIVGDTPVAGPFPDRDMRRESIPARETGPADGVVEIRRGVQISRSNIGCVPDLTLHCRTPLKEPSMPVIEGFQG